MAEVHGWGPVGELAGERRGAGRTPALALRRWALARGLVASPAALDAILEAVLDAEVEGVLGVEARTGDAAGRWTAATVEQLLWAGVLLSCRRRGRPVPTHVAETLWSLLGYLADTGRLAPGSDDLGRLRAPLVACGGLGPDGRRRATAERRTPPRRRGRGHPAAASAVVALAPVVPLAAAREAGHARSGGSPGRGSSRVQARRRGPRPLLRSGPA